MPRDCGVFFCKTQHSASPCICGIELDRGKVHKSSHIFVKGLGYRYLSYSLRKHNVPLLVEASIFYMGLHNLMAAKLGVKMRKVELHVKSWMLPKNNKHNSNMFNHKLT